MNDKNFIEELRQKREEYGVTQTRLAVACGISREYYNRIEKGKQPLPFSSNKTPKCSCMEHMILMSPSTYLLSYPYFP